ncbi:carbohydrate ABC transporter substrate-binding protein [Phytoactinopolyspora alkaliphila]|uniref:Carbohydrate ABC transporter substrate-binding protein n=1 Tax=Phytoactinopolyspora alkaliphila TaxID=1783498 RepID=A0A6N9YPY9_9ACTN|nr:ABC transporter substrate-binding protein [Phytoactinopolyspora alkaliphila]NED97116.1 carbohydrate ABC transporter substrate-binding protein [Phytoactinopolyspora alkaliphila]
MNVRIRWIALVAAGLILAACSSDVSTRGEEPVVKEPATDESIRAAAEQAAQQAAGGEDLSGTVSMLGVMGGEELDALKSVLEPFEHATGVDVQYEGTRDFTAVLQTRIDGGNPPDLVMTPAIGEMAGLAEQGALTDLRGVIGGDVLNENYTESLLETGSSGGELFGLFNTVNLGGLVWYNPKTYDGPTAPADWDELQHWATEKAKAGEAPWCVGLESGAASGWPAADFIDEILLRQAGPEFHERWRDGDVPWTSPEVRQAFQTYGQMVTEEMMYGGVMTALSTSFVEAGTPMFPDPPGCYLLQQATFMGGIITDSFPDVEPGEDLDFFPVPDFSAEHPGIRSISGEVVGMVNETPESAALVRYLASAEAGALVAATGRWLSPNTNVDADLYGDPFLSKANQLLNTAEITSPLGNALMPQIEVDAFWQAGLSYTQHPGELEDILQTIQDAR